MLSAKPARARDGAQIYGVWNPKNRDAGVPFRREPQHVGEVQVERDQLLYFFPTHFDQLVVGCAAEVLFGDGSYFMSGFSE